MQELEDMTLLELRNYAKEQNIKNISKLKKEELISLLKQIKETSSKKDEPKTESKGIKLQKGNIGKPYAEVLLSWKVVEKRIQKLIEEDRYHLHSKVQ